MLPKEKIKMICDESSDKKSKINKTHNLLPYINSVPNKNKINTSAIIMKNKVKIPNLNRLKQVLH
jgi:hypothetical protein